MMRLLFILLCSLSAGVAMAQQSGMLVMHVGPAPDYRLSFGLAVQEQGRTMMRARLEMAPDCTWSGVAALDVTEQEVNPVFAIAANQTAAAYGVANAGVYASEVAERGGVASASYVACIEQAVTSRGEAQLRDR